MNNYTRLGWLEMMDGAAGRKALTEIRYGVKLMWEAVKSCFGSGGWINDAPWDNDEGWDNG